jgi:hypothetical protein
MSLLGSYRQQEVDEFPGPDLLSDARSTLGARLARNVRYLYTEVLTRLGFAEAFDITATIATGSQATVQLPVGLAVHSFYHWLHTTWSRLVFFSPADGGHPDTAQAHVTVREFSSGLTQGVVDVPATTTGAAFAEFGSRLVMAFFGDQGAATTLGKIWNGLFSSNPLGAIVDDLFVPPMVEGTHYSVAYAEPVAGANNVTEGEHKFGIVWRTRQGYETKATIFNNTFTASGDLIVRITLTNIAVEDWSLDLRIIMTTASNPNLFYFIPDQLASLPPGLPSVVIDIDVTDDQLAASATPATPWFNIADNTEIGNVKFALPYMNRMVYLVDMNDAANTLGSVTRILISDPGDPQWITLDRNIQQLPGVREAVTAFSMYNTLYVLGPSWTYALSDTTDFPVNWYGAELIDGRIGTKFPHGCAVNPSRGIGWVLNPDGLYPFQGGAYPGLPTSYFQTPDWDRINWSAPVWCFEVADDSLNDTVYIKVPLDGAVRPTHIMAWDYKKGVGPKPTSDGRYSLNSILGPDGMRRLGAIGIVTNFDNDIPEFWYAQATASASSRGKFWRQKSEAASDAKLWNDDGFGIDSQYRTKSPVGVNGAPVRHAAARFRVTGEGSCRVQAYRLDQKNPRPLRDLELSLAPGKEHLRTLDVINEACYYDFWNKAVPDTHFRLSHITHFWGEWTKQR